MVFSVTKKETAPFDGQKPGTSGLRKKVRSPPFPCSCFCGPDPDLNAPPAAWSGFGCRDPR
jgi:hypothetical protein